MEKRLNIVIPYRDREAHLKVIVPYLRAYFARDKLDHVLEGPVVERPAVWEHIKVRLKMKPPG